MNNWSVIGRVGKDAVVRTTQAGKAVASWSMAVDVGYGENKQTTWVDCSLWGDRAHKLAPCILKGDRIGVMGEHGTREYEGKTYTTLRAADVTLLGNKNAPMTPKSAPAPAQEAAFEDDEIPF